jgi:hypothetical protein
MAAAVRHPTSQDIIVSTLVGLHSGELSFPLSFQSIMMTGGRRILQIRLIDQIISDLDDAIGPDFYKDPQTIYRKVVWDIFYNETEVDFVVDIPLVERYLSAYGIKECSLTDYLYVIKFSKSYFKHVVKRGQSEYFFDTRLRYKNIPEIGDMILERIEYVYQSQKRSKFRVRRSR